MIKDKFEQFRQNILNQAIEVSDSTNKYQCMDLAYLWVFCLGYPKSTIQQLYAYNVFLKPKEITRKYFDIIPNTPDFVPKVGDLVVFDKEVADGNIAGHIGIATGDGNIKVFDSLDQNWNVQRATVVTHNYNKLLGVLRPKVEGFDANSDIPTETEEALKLKDYDWYDKKWSWADLISNTDKCHLIANNAQKACEGLVEANRTLLEENLQLKEQLKEVDAVPETAIKWWKSKTVLANFAVILGIVAQLLTGFELPIDPELQVLILAIVNALLRFITKRPIVRSIV